MSSSDCFIIASKCAIIRLLRVERQRMSDRAELSKAEGDHLSELLSVNERRRRRASTTETEKERERERKKEMLLWLAMLCYFRLRLGSLPPSAIGVSKLLFHPVGDVRAKRRERIR